MTLRRADRSLRWLPMIGHIDEDDPAPADWSDEVLILGAGFSKAVSAHFPLTDDLGNHVRALLEQTGHERWLPEGDFEHGYFEAWLSSIAEDQPDLPASDNQERHSVFTRCVGLIHETLVERSQSVGGSPDWLLRLIWLAHVRRMVIVTFNYDTTLEHAADRAAIVVGGVADPYTVTSRDALQDLPPMFNEPRRSITLRTFRLLKLHGSLDWYWSQSDQSGTSIVRSPERCPPGLVPFLTPPTAAKSAFYANPVSHELWAEAGRALGRARRVVLMGYSLPPTDLTVSAMLRRHLERDDVDIVVVNPCPTPVAEQLTRLGLGARVAEVDGDDAIAKYVADLERRCSRDLLDRMMATPPADLSAPLVVPGAIYARGVEAIERTPQGLLLGLSVPSLERGFERQVGGDWSPHSRTIGDLIKAADGRPGTITARTPRGAKAIVVADRVRSFGEVVRSHHLVPSIGPLSPEA